MPEDTEEPLESIARRHFHWCLAAVLVPIISLPLQWTVTVAHRGFTESTPEHRRWSRWLFGLTIVDTILAALIIALFASGAWGWGPLTEWVSRPRGDAAVRIGVTVAASPERPDEAEIASVATDSPAERAGLRTRDVLISIDGDPVQTVEDLPRVIRSGTAGVPRTLRIRRAGKETDIVVTPEIRPAIPAPAPALLDVVPTSSCLRDSVNYLRSLLRWRGLWAAGFLMSLLWLIGRRVQVRAPPLWLWVGVALSSEVVAGALASLGLCISVGGHTVVGSLVAGLAQSSIFLLVGLIAMRQMAGGGLRSLRLEPVLSARRAVILGFFYLAVVHIRWRVFYTAFEAFGHLHLPAATARDSMASGFAALAWQGWILGALRVALVAPVAEEVPFRGVILPRLAAWMGAAWAMVATSTVFALLHEGVGNEPFGFRAAGVFVIALAFAWARLRTGGLAAPITMHVIINTLSLLAHR